MLHCGMLECQSLAFVGGCTIFGHFALATCPSIGVHRAGRTPFHAWKPECLNSSYLFKHFCFPWMMNLWTQLQWQARLPKFSLL